MADPSVPLAASARTRIELSADDDHRAVLALSAPPERPVAELTWIGAFARRVALNPDALAVVCENEVLTYRELDRRARTVARALRAHGTHDEDVVAVAMPRSVDMVVALLGVMRAGAAYLPIDLDHPPDRIAFMLRDAGARIVVTDRELAGELPSSTICAPCCSTRSCSGARARRRRRRPTRRPTRRPVRARPRRLRHLHLRLDRSPQGRRRLARGDRQPDRDRRRPARRRREQPRRAVRLGRLRRRRLRPVHDARRRRLRGDRAHPRAASPAPPSPTTSPRSASPT